MWEGIVPIVPAMRRAVAAARALPFGSNVADAKDISARATANAATTLIPVAVPTSVGATSSLELETSTQCHCKVPEA